MATPGNSAEIVISPTPQAAIKNGKTVSPPIVPPPPSPVQSPQASAIPPSSPPPNQRPKAGTPARQSTKPMSWWQPLLLWGGSLVLIVVAILAALYVKNEELLNSAGSDTPANVIDSVDPESPPETPANLQPFISQNPAIPSTEAGNRAILNRARSYLQAAQASGFNRAIQEAGKIPAGSPLYEEAKLDIRRWSQVILDIAVGRANEGNYSGAIAAAKLVPEDVPPVYEKAQELLEGWSMKVQEQQSNQALIDNAKALIDPSQASSYVKAIATVREIQPGKALYDDAQELINQWSRQIYLIANSRAARGSWE
ncbi:MAG: hypothetical protein ACOC0N_01410, partial [Chroococcales cyanobacterium]